MNVHRIGELPSDLIADIESSAYGTILLMTLPDAGLDMVKRKGPKCL